ncbi:TrmH family RNA methyltransferase [Raineyella fluvialis]|uniref:RNA methyltransferase n=1 Tax=Raineyella fluvialis TaxID=2662261 RepID=A0A5Q2FEP9_9ACTN|nr:RNA methyltransferase [Raineyella fluvialis]QGF24871.1 RNA methyltransferase [Raineyella fluvialis]
MTSAQHGPAGSQEPSGARVRSVRRLTSRKHREEEGQFLAEGRQAVREALTHGDVIAVWVDRDLADRHHVLVAQAEAAGVPVYAVGSHLIAGLSDTVTPQGILAQVATPAASLDDVLSAAPRLVLVCAQIRDPGNLGAVVRVADAFGADAVVCTKGSVEWTNPKVVRASVGSVFHLPLVTGLALADVADRLRAAGLQILAADGGGDDLQDYVTRGLLTRPTAWVMGNEAWGLPEEDAALADAVVGVPIWGQAESLNLATAAAVCLWTTASAQRIQD